MSGLGPGLGLGLVPVSGSCVWSRSRSRSGSWSGSGSLSRSAPVLLPVLVASMPFWWTGTLFSILNLLDGGSILEFWRQTDFSYKLTTGQTSPAPSARPPPTSMYRTFLLVRLVLGEAPGRTFILLTSSRIPRDLATWNTSRQVHNWQRVLGHRSTTEPAQLAASTQNQNQDHASPRCCGPPGAAAPPGGPRCSPGPPGALGPAATQTPGRCLGSGTESERRTPPGGAGHGKHRFNFLSPCH